MKGKFDLRVNYHSQFENLYKFSIIFLFILSQKQYGVVVGFNKMKRILLKLEAICFDVSNIVEQNTDNYIQVVFD